MDSRELRDILEGSGPPPGAQVYVPAQVTDIFAISLTVVPHPAGCALQFACANGVVYRYPVDWNALQDLKRVVAGARIAGQDTTNGGDDG